MPTDPRALKSIADALIRLVEELRKEERPQHLSFPNPEWRILGLGRTTVAYRRPETIEALIQFRNRFRRAGWVARWSDEFVWDVERNVIADALDDSSEEAVMSSLVGAAEILDAEPPEYVVVLPLAWIHLGEFKMTFADIEVQTITEERLAAIRQGFYAIIAMTPHTEDQQKMLVGDADKLTELLRNRPAAFVSVRGDKDFANERALKMVAPVVDLMQLASAIYHQLDDVSIAVGGDLLTKQPPVLIIAKDGSNIHHEGRYAFGHRYEMEPEHLEGMRSKGFGPLLDSLTKSETERTEFERILLRSMHWVAEAERQASTESKTTAYITAIDMFFAKQGEPLTRDITEGTATLLGSTLEGRRQVVKMMERFYKLRSGVSHVGEQVTEDDIRGLKGLTISFLARMSAMSSKFETKDAFRSWLVDQRLTPSTTQSNDS